MNSAPVSSSARETRTDLGVAFLGPVDPAIFRSADDTLRALRLQPTPPSPSDMPAGEVRAFEPFRQEDAERALHGASAIVLGLPVPVPPAAVTHERRSDAQSFVVDGLMAAAESRGIRHIALVKPDPPGSKHASWDELGRIVRAYGMDVLELAADEAPQLGDAVARWLDRCARLARSASPAHVDPARLALSPRRAGRRMRSLQRLQVPRGWNALRLGNAYVAWLGAAFPWLLRTETEADGSFQVFAAFSRDALLELEADTRLSAPRRHVLRVSGGSLAAEPEVRDGWLEFRILPGGKDAIAAVGDFVPRLPWPLYRMTQAPAHRLIMAGFAKHLRNFDDPHTEPRRTRSSTRPR